MHSTALAAGKLIQGSRTMRNRPYPVLKCSSSFTINLLCDGRVRERFLKTNKKSRLPQGASGNPWKGQTPTPCVAEASLAYLRTHLRRARSFFEFPTRWEPKIFAVHHKKEKLTALPGSVRRRVCTTTVVLLKSREPCLRCRRVRAAPPAPPVGAGPAPSVALAPTPIPHAERRSVTPTVARHSLSHAPVAPAVSNYKADAKEADRNRKRLMALIKRPGNNRCADCPARCELLPPACPLPAACVSRPRPPRAGKPQWRRTRGRRLISAASSASSARASTATSACTSQRRAHSPTAPQSSPSPRRHLLTCVHAPPRHPATPPPPHHRPSRSTLTFKPRSPTTKVRSLNLDSWNDDWVALMERRRWSGDGAEIHPR